MAMSAFFVLRSGRCRAFARPLRKPHRDGHQCNDQQCHTACTAATNDDNGNDNACDATGCKTTAAATTTTTTTTVAVTCRPIRGAPSLGRWRRKAPIDIGELVKTPHTLVSNQVNGLLACIAIGNGATVGTILCHGNGHQKSRGHQKCPASVHFKEASKGRIIQKIKNTGK